MAHIQLSGGQCAEIHPDGFSDHGYVLEIGGAEQSHVDVQNPDYVFYEYLRRIANAVDALAPAGEPITAAHLGARCAHPRALYSGDPPRLPPGCRGY